LLKYTGAHHKETLKESREKYENGGKLKCALKKYADGNCKATLKKGLYEDKDYAVEFSKKRYTDGNCETTHEKGVYEGKDFGAKYVSRKYADDNYEARLHKLSYADQDCTRKMKVLEQKYKDGNTVIQIYEQSGDDDFF
jgi:hypothetical protein